MALEVMPLGNPIPKTLAAWIQEILGSHAAICWEFCFATFRSVLPHGCCAAWHLYATLTSFRRKAILAINASTEAHGLIWSIETLSVPESRLSVAVVEVTWRKTFGCSNASGTFSV
jgi:hypothetical protein